MVSCEELNGQHVLLQQRCSNQGEELAQARAKHQRVSMELVGMKSKVDLIEHTTKQQEQQVKLMGASTYICTGIHKTRTHRYTHIHMNVQTHTLHSHCTETHVSAYTTHTHTHTHTHMRTRLCRLFATLLLQHTMKAYEITFLLVYS